MVWQLSCEHACVHCRYATHLFNDAEDLEEDGKREAFWQADMLPSSDKQVPARQPSHLTALKDDHHEEEYW